MESTKTTTTDVEFSITAAQRRPGFVRHPPAEEPYDEPDGSAFSFIFLGLERVEGFKRIGGTGGQ